MDMRKEIGEVVETLHHENGNFRIVICRNSDGTYSLHWEMYVPKNENPDPAVPAGLVLATAATGLAVSQDDAPAKNKIQPSVSASSWWKNSHPTQGARANPQHLGDGLHAWSGTTFTPIAQVATAPKWSKADS